MKIFLHDLGGWYWFARWSGACAIVYFDFGNRPKRWEPRLFFFLKGVLGCIDERRSRLVLRPLLEDDELKTAFCLFFLFFSWLGLWMMRVRVFGEVFVCLVIRWGNSDEMWRRIRWLPEKISPCCCWSLLLGWREWREGDPLFLQNQCHPFLIFWIPYSNELVGDGIGLSRKQVAERGC